MSAPSSVAASTSTTTISNGPTSTTQDVDSKDTSLTPSNVPTPKTSTASSAATQPDPAAAKLAALRKAEEKERELRELGERLIVRELFARSDAAAAAVERAARKAAILAREREEKEMRDRENLAALMELRAQHPVGPPPPDPPVLSYDVHDAELTRAYAAVVAEFPDLNEEDRKEALLWLQNDFRLIESRLSGDAVVKAKINHVHRRFRDVRARKEMMAMERKIREERAENRRAEEITKKEAEMMRRREEELRKKRKEKKRLLDEEPDVLGGWFWGVTMGMLVVASAWCWKV
jgi:hypothetical protein